MAETDSELTVTLTLTEEDAVRLKETVLRHRKIILLGGIIAVVMLVPCMAGYIARARDGSLSDWLSIPLFLVLLSLTLLVFIPWRFRQRVRKAFRNSPNAQLETTYRFTSWGIFLSSAIGRKEMTWEAITEVLETKKDFIFFTSMQMAFLLPKAALSSRDQRQCLRRIVTDGAGDRAVLQPNEDEVQS